jgi:hypothetical protein
MTDLDLLRLQSLIESLADAMKRAMADEPCAHEARDALIAIRQIEAAGRAIVGERRIEVP